MQALANQGTALQSHRGGTGEIRYTGVEIVDAAGRTAVLFAPGDTLVVRASYRADRPWLGRCFRSR